MKTILVPTDFSRYADDALRLAILLATRTKSKIRLLNVLDYNDVVYGALGTGMASDYMLDSFTTLKGVSEERLEERNKIAQEQGIETEPIVRSGLLIDVIEQEIKESNAYLVVMGTKGSSGLEEMVMGSNTEKIVRKSSVPVLSVNKRIHDLKIDHILFANEFKEGIGQGFQFVLDIADLFGATIHLLRVNTPNNFQSTSTGLGLMEDFAQKWNLKKYTKTQYDHHFLNVGIIEVREMVEADMVAIGTHGRSGLAHFFLGSMTEDLVNTLDTPILSFKID